MRCKIGTRRCLHQTPTPRSNVRIRVPIVTGDKKLAVRNTCARLWEEPSGKTTDGPDDDPLVRVRRTVAPPRPPLCGGEILVALPSSAGAAPGGWGVGTPFAAAASTGLQDRPREVEIKEPHCPVFFSSSWSRNMSTGQSWLIDSKRIATKIKSASETCDPRKIVWRSNPTRECPNCNHTIDNSDVVQQWPGLPRGVKFDPSDQELLWHLCAKVGEGDPKPHPFIDEFIPTLEGDDGICYTHPRKLPGVKQDGSVSHFFHRTFKAYNTGTRKRRKIHNDDLGDVRWHKTGKTKPVMVDGLHQGCKKIMVLYMSSVKGGKAEKTNWVMHQYHLGTGEDEKDGEFVVSKVFYQQQCKQNEKNEVEPQIEIEEKIVREAEPILCPKSVTPDPPPEKRYRDLSSIHLPNQETVNGETESRGEANCILPDCEKLDDHGSPSLVANTHGTENIDAENGVQPDCGRIDDSDNRVTEDPKWWEGESQFLLDSQQLAEGMALCEEFLQSQSSCGDGETRQSRPRLSDYAQMGVENLKQDLEECQKLSSSDLANIDLDTPPDMRLSQLEFGSQDSFLAWGGSKVAD